MPRIHFPNLAAQVLPHLPTLLQHQLPGGRFHGREYIACNPTRQDHHPGSFRINLRTGRWADFATGDCGRDPVSLIAYLHRTSQTQAATWLQQWLGHGTPSFPAAIC